MYFRFIEVSVFDFIDEYTGSDGLWKQRLGDVYYINTKIKTDIVNLHFRSVVSRTSSKLLQKNKSCEQL